MEIINWQICMPKWTVTHNHHYGNKRFHENGIGTWKSHHARLNVPNGKMSMAKCYFTNVQPCDFLTWTVQSFPTNCKCKRHVAHSLKKKRICHKRTGFFNLIFLESLVFAHQTLNVCHHQKEIEETTSNKYRNANKSTDTKPNLPFRPMKR